MLMSYTAGLLSNLFEKYYNLEKFQHKIDEIVDEMNAESDEPVKVTYFYRWLVQGYI